MLLSSAPYGIGVAGAASNDGDVQGGEEIVLVVAIDGSNRVEPSDTTRRHGSTDCFSFQFLAAAADHSCFY